MRSSEDVPAPGLLAAVESLAAAIRRTPDWRNWRDAHEAAERDPDLAGMVARYQNLAARLRGTRDEGKSMPNQDVLEFDGLQRQIEDHELFRRRDETTAELVELLVAVNGMLSDGIEIDFAAVAAPRRSCCG